MIRRIDFAHLNGQRYLRYGDDHNPALVLFHETAVDEVRAIESWIAEQRAGEADWRPIYRSGGTMTARMQVPGGWLVKHTSDDGASMAFVPDAKHSWKTKILNPGE